MFFFVQHSVSWINWIFIYHYQLFCSHKRTHILFLYFNIESHKHIYEKMTHVTSILRRATVEYKKKDLKSQIENQTAQKSRDNAIKDKCIFTRLFGCCFCSLISHSRIVFSTCIFLLLLLNVVCHDVCSQKRTTIDFKNRTRVWVTSWSIVTETQLTRNSLFCVCSYLFNAFDGCTMHNQSCNWKTN